MIIHDHPQGSDAWFEARCGIISASELHNILTPKFEPRTGQMPASYIALKVAERWCGVLQTFSGGSMEQGSIRENEARPWLALELDVDIEPVGFITTDDGKFGCSPDGWAKKTIESLAGLDEPHGFEIKCPEPHTHMKWLLAGGVPDDHLAQVHGGMLATGATQWVFLSYRPDMPKHVVTVHRSEGIMQVMTDTIRKTNEQIDAAYAKLVKQFGPPKRASRFKASIPDTRRVADLVGKGIKVEKAEAK